MPKPREMRSSAPTHKAVEVEKQLEELERQTIAEVEEKPSKPEGESETPKPESAPGKETTPKEEPKVIPKAEGQPPAEEPEELTDEEVQQLSKKAQKRFQKLSSAVKERDELKKRIGELEVQSGKVEKESEPVEELDEELGLEEELIAKGTEEKKPGKLAWEIPEAETEPSEITVEDYKKDVEQTAEKKVKEILKQQGEQRFNNLLFRRFKSDVKRIESEHDILNPQSENYDPDLTDKVANNFRQLFQANKKVRFYTFVKDHMGLLERGIELGKSQVSGKVAQQSGEQAISPTGESAPRKSNVEEKIKSARTMDELEEAEKLLPHA